MLGGAAKKESISRLKIASEEYAAAGEAAKDESIALLNLRKGAAAIILHVEEYVNTLANTPKEFKATFSEIHIHMDKFQAILDIKYEDKKTTQISGSVAGAGALAGAGVAALGPTAAMAIATTFGTASTGTAISALSGAAATKAALAWLGGGALAKGGLGIAGGKALLAAAGPVGWAIGGAALIGSALFAKKKNKEIAEKAQKEAVEVVKQTKVLQAATVEIKELQNMTKRHTLYLRRQLRDFRRKFPSDYLEFSVEQKQEIGALVNNTLALSALINRQVGKKN